MNEWEDYQVMHMEVWVLFQLPANHQLVINQGIDLSRVKLKAELSELSCLN